MTTLAEHWHSLRVAVANTPEALAALRQLQQDKDTGVVVLALYNPAAAAADGAASDPTAAAGVKEPRPSSGSREKQLVVCRVTGLVKRWQVEQGLLHVHIRPCCGRHPDDPSSPCCQVSLSY